MSRLCTCGHTENVHSVINGRCLRSPGGRRCSCPDFAAAAEEVGRTIPARNTDPVTSHAATKAVTLRAGSQRLRLLEAFAALTDATAEEAMNAADGVSPTSEYAKRCSELKDGGYVEETGEQRATGHSGLPRDVLRITDRGRAALRAD